jgi:uncharacterized protein (TIGR03067 family)
MNHAILALGLILADGGDSGQYRLVAHEQHAELQRGEWRLVGMVNRGAVYPADILEAGDVRLTFKGDKATMRQAGVWSRTDTFRLDPERPNEIDWTVERGRGAGIFELKDGTLKIALGTAGRPRDFTGNGDVLLYVLKRVGP